MVRRPLPAAARLKDAMRRRLGGQVRGAPHMIETATAVAGGPVLSTVAPPGIASFRRRDELATEVDPVVRSLEPAQGLNLDRRMADDVKERLVAPDVAFQGCDVEVADDQCRLSQLFRPARHPLDKVQFLAEFRVLCSVGDIAAGRYLDILKADSAVEPGTDMPSLAIVLPVVAAAIVKRDATENCDAMMHLLAIKLVMDIAARMEEAGWKYIVLRLGLLKAEDVGLFLVKEAFDDGRAGAHGVDVPGSDLERGHGLSTAYHECRTDGLLAACPRQATKGGPFHACLGDKHEKALAPGAWSKGRPSVVTQGDRH